MSQWENAKRLPSIEDVSAILGYLRVTGERRERIRALARHAREPNWLAPSNPDLPQALTAIAEFEKTATAITTWSPTVIPGLLQTADYIRTIMDNSFVPIEQADIRLRIRLGRQKILTKQEPVRLRAIFSERILRDGIGNDDIMSDQVDHLLKMTEWANISVHIVPCGVVYHPGFVGPFEVYEFPETPPVILLEHHRSTALLHDDYHTTAYQRLAKLILGYALDEVASRALLQEVAR
jgi:hypothetical protein